MYKQLSGTRLGCFPKHFALCLQPILDLMAFGSSPLLEQFVRSNANLFQKLGSRSRLSNRPSRHALSTHIIAPSQMGGVCILGDGLSRPVMNVEPANAASLGRMGAQGLGCAQQISLLDLGPQYHSEQPAPGEEGVPCARRSRYEETGARIRES